MHSDSDYENDSPEVPDDTSKADVLEVPDEAPEADVLEQFKPSSDLEDHDEETTEIPAEADPADFDEQRRSLGVPDEDEYR